jgi:hypothetical protein
VCSCGMFPRLVCGVSLTRCIRWASGGTLQPDWHTTKKVIVRRLAVCCASRFTHCAAAGRLKAMIKQIRSIIVRGPAIAEVQITSKSSALRAQKKIVSNVARHTSPFRCSKRCCRRTLRWRAHSLQVASCSILRMDVAILTFTFR